MSGKWKSCFIGKPSHFHWAKQLLPSYPLSSLWKDPRHFQLRMNGVTRKCHPISLLFVYKKQENCNIHQHMEAPMQYLIRLSLLYQLSIKYQDWLQTDKPLNRSTEYGISGYCKLSVSPQKIDKHKFQVILVNECQS